MKREVVGGPARGGQFRWQGSFWNQSQNGNQLQTTIRKKYLFLDQICKLESTLIGGGYVVDSMFLLSCCIIFVGGEEGLGTIKGIGT